MLSVMLVSLRFSHPITKRWSNDEAGFENWFLKPEASSDQPHRRRLMFLCERTFLAQVRNYSQLVSCRSRPWEESFGLIFSRKARGMFRKHEKLSKTSHDERAEIFLRQSNSYLMIAN